MVGNDEISNHHCRIGSARGLIGQPMTLAFRLYDPSQIETCLNLFDSNCPAFFATEERRDYFDFLAAPPLNYFLGLDGNNVVCAFGYSATSDEYPSLNWIMVIPAYQSRGAGGAMMGQYIDYLVKNQKQFGSISTSQHAEPYFQRYGAVRIGYEEHGWGEGMHRVEMRLPVADKLHTANKS
jgi:GNAT superfamily N-acetyltransferase